MLQSNNIIHKKAKNLNFLINDYTFKIIKQIVLDFAKKSLLNFIYMLQLHFFAEIL
ncbi:hypothetical protein NUSPORA_03028 [Nucleospora cyclopteri]